MIKKTQYNKQRNETNRKAKKIIIILIQIKIEVLIYFNGIIKVQLNDTPIHNYLYNYYNSDWMQIEKEDEWDTHEK